MTDSELAGVIDPADDPALIPGIHHYCDRWCARCAFQDRCEVYRSTRPTNSRDAINDPLDRSRERTKADPLVWLALEYARTSWNILRVLRPIVQSRDDARALRAITEIEAIAGTIASKVFRAVSSSLAPEFDPSEPQTDANGSAKLARLLIARSQGAWRVLMEAGRARANGAPAGLVRMLEDLDVGLDVRFPQAMDFIRPGFDTVGSKRPVAGH